MKRQYLGDSKDCFKWDYHDFLVSHLGFSVFNIALMLTRDDEGSHGQTRPSLFPARKEIVRFCQELRASRTLQQIKCLPSVTGADYKVSLHNEETLFADQDRKEYFSNLDGSTDQLIFLDPDVGFQPENYFGEQHVTFKDLARILEQVTDNSVVTVFQNFRYIKFQKDFQCIRERNLVGKMAAVYWHSLMFVAVSKSKDAIKEVIAANSLYEKSYPVTAIV
jgi:hypothetical protein